MKKIKIILPIFIPFDNKYNIDYFSLEKLILLINNFNIIDNIILFDNYYEYNCINNNEIIDIINCIQNNNKKNINIILKINNIYNYNEICNIINKNIYKDIYYIILEYPKLSKIYKKEIINNYNKIFKKYKYLNFFIEIKKKKYINEKIFLKIKNNNLNFIGLINKTNFFFKNLELINNIKIYIYNDINFFNCINNNINGIISPLFYILLNYINKNIIYNIKKKKIIIYNKKYYYFLKLINYLYNIINPISGIKYFLKKIKICKIYNQLPCNNIKNINVYNKINKLYKLINI
ncbi:MAG: hypothetical protein NHG12_01075 [Candidatus Shikimatogenerans bostrichidophilus]|nr:MAG: hypothetical protein NHG12_01075 [Candidatus Shikimatogenerans bostrichidophilus]